MNDPYYAFPNIVQSIVLVVLVFVSHFVAELVFSFIEDYTLVSLLSEVFKLCLLLFFLKYMTKWDNIDVTQFKMASPNMIILACGFLCGLCIAFFPSPWVISYFDEHQIETLIEEAITNKVTIFYFFYMCLVAPIFEELVFRGVILGGLLKRYSPTVAIIVSSFLFGIVHPFVLDGYLAGLLWGWIYYRSHNILYCITIHILINSVGFALRYAIHKDYLSFESFAGFTEFSWMPVVLFVLIICACLYIMHLTFKKKLTLTEGYQ